MKKENKSPSTAAPSAADQMKAVKAPLVEDSLMENEDIFYQIKMWQSIKAAPSYRLFEILPKVTVDKLRDIYRAHLLSPAAGKLKKQQLIDALLQALPDGHELEGFILTQPDMQWAFFRDALKAKELKEEQDMMDWAAPACSYGYVYLFYHQGEFTYVVPDEVKAAYEKIDKQELHEHMEVTSWLNYIARAAVNLYGVLSLDDLGQLINKQSKNKEGDLLTPDILEFCLMGYAVYNDDYRIQNGYLASIAFTDDEDDLDMEWVQNLLELRKEKPCYLPDMKVFLRYADPEYYEQTPQVKALKKALRAMGLSVNKTQELVDTLHDKIAAEEEVSEVIHSIEECGVTLESDHADKILQLIMNLFNATRLWCNFGHTPDEIAKLMGREEPRAIHFGPGIAKMLARGDLNINDLEQSAQSFQMINEDFKKSFMSEITRMKSLTNSDTIPKAENNVVPLHKPGRNDPCPCGSGLKYKKCCGKKSVDPGGSMI